MQSGLPRGTEKAKSELLIVPVLLELYHKNPNHFQYFSGYNFDIDKENALTGRCDFILSKSQSVMIESPVISIFEAKDDSLEHWYGQCGAEMYASHLFNQQHNSNYKIIHGAVSNGTNWQFLRLENDFLYIDDQFYTIQDLPKLLGVLQTVIDFYK